VSAPDSVRELSRSGARRVHVRAGESMFEILYLLDTAAKAAYDRKVGASVRSIRIL
jgi:hypothetical protein